ncbi:hypothetical protein HG537_0G02410 [Torulaspora globosa]|uniref:HBS1-like protein N-terminal domain-containing protein n=1 Tax=Torulaspora globosa TaxID=48254 RepID=A0A7H9HYQ6_9SACH|nr:hypothetical protein HG537_0G02410 [Torulaspora sp. CBS 2947]
MPSYADDYDSMDYENGIPEFQDEAEFDDYLNDEEFELMNDLFPRAKKELQEYQGWNNLAVKQAIFDCDFNLDEALIELKKAYKKKKKQPVASQPSRVVNGMLKLLWLEIFFHSFRSVTFFETFYLLSWLHVWYVNLCCLVCLESLRIVNVR